MTYIAGWKNKTSVFIIADSAITYGNKPSVENAKVWSDISTFGEKHISEDEKVVQEQWLKIYNIDNRLILAFGGDVSTAHETVDNLKYYLKTDEWRDIKGCFEHVCKNSGGGEVKIIAGFIEGDTPTLISYDCNKSRGFKEHDHFELVYGGSISYEFIEYSRRLFSKLQECPNNDDQILVNIGAVFQSYRYIDYLINQGVGGHFSGIRIDKSGIHWQKDTSYIPFQHNGQSLSSFQLSAIFGKAPVITIMVRDNLEFIGSPFTHFRFSRRPFGNYQPKKILESKAWQDERFNWACKWNEEVNRVIDKFDVDYFVFINVEQPIITIFSKEVIDAFSLFELKIDGEQKSFLFNPESFFELLKLLTTPINDEFTIRTFVGLTTKFLS